MQFCEECGSLLPADEATGACGQCGTSFEQSTPDRPTSDDGSERSAPSTDLERLPTTASGSVKKADAIEWLAERDRPSGADLCRATVEKPSDFSGTTFPTDISTIRFTGDPEFIETVAGLFAWVVDVEDYSRRVEINLKETEDRETSEATGNYALYLSIAERG